MMTSQLCCNKNTHTHKQSQTLRTQTLAEFVIIQKLTGCVCFDSKLEWKKTIWRLQYTRHPCQFYFLHSVSLEFRVRAKSWNPIRYFNHITIVDRVSAQAILLQSGHMMEPDSFFLVFGKIEVIHGPLTNHLQT